MDISRFRLLCIQGVADPYFYACPHKKDSDPPDPNPGQIANAEVAEKLGMEQIGIAKDQLAWSKEIGAEQLDLARQVMEQQIRIGDANEARATDQWESYEKLFAPVEERMVDEAMKFDSPERQERVAGEAAADVSRAFDAQEQNADRDAMSFGFDPSSRRTTGTDRAMGLERVKATAGAMTDARRDTELQGMAMRESAAKFGRGMTSTGIATDSLALASGSSASGTLNNAVGSVNQSNANARGWYGSGMQGVGQAGQIYNQEYQNRLNAWQTSVGAQSGALAGVGSLVGTIGAAAILSSKEFKEGGTPVDEEAALEGLKRVPVENWKYKDGIADGGGHVGPYAEDVQAQFGDGVAPGGQAIDIVSMNGVLTAGLRALARKVDRLEGKRGGRGSRDTEPTPEGLQMMSTERRYA